MKVVKLRRVLHPKAPELLNYHLHAAPELLNYHLLAVQGISRMNA
jgi:hypothetical protein